MARAKKSIKGFKGDLQRRIVSRKAKVGVIGLGYVGLPLAIEFAEAGFTVMGIDIDKRRVNSIRRKETYITDVLAERVANAVDRRRLFATTDYKKIGDVDVIVICVPTPLRKTKEPDISFIIKAVEEIVKYKRRGQLIILESTTYPGTTEEVVLPMLSSKGMSLNKDFLLAFSPERVDPGNKSFKTKDIPKVVGGVSKSSTDVAALLYNQIIRRVMRVSSSRVAELVKLLENTFRSVNIGLVNEFALLCDKLSIDVWEVIEAAKSKPFGFMPFYPGPGIGGHCINIDPLYLSWKARLHGFETRFIELAQEVNMYMPRYVVERVRRKLNEKKMPLKGSRILIMGIAYKKDVNDTRESPAIDIIKMLINEGAAVFFHDPYINKLKINGATLKSKLLNKKFLKTIDCTIIATDHSSIDYKELLKNSSFIFDVRGALRKIKGAHAKKIMKL
ncbi:MAG: nucleotide sugar dehydrogenase [Candidatus Omnitrophica bacterium]|nr:nucleotide sugar dehydrogenase [Candidatus Omnitrophota bacterium]